MQCHRRNESSRVASSVLFHEMYEVHPKSLHCFPVKLAKIASPKVCQRRARLGNMDMAVRVMPESARTLSIVKNHNYYYTNNYVNDFHHDSSGRRQGSRRRRCQAIMPNDRNREKTMWQVAKSKSQPVVLS
jgi:hypothetical protein